MKWAFGRKRLTHIRVGDVKDWDNANYVLKQHLTVIKDEKEKVLVLNKALRNYEDLLSQAFEAFAKNDKKKFYDLISLAEQNAKQALKISEKLFRETRKLK
jgi:hypothetical protein